MSKEELENFYKEQDEKNEKVFNKQHYCREHNFKLEADVLMREYDAVRRVLRDFRIKFNINL